MSTLTELRLRRAARRRRTATVSSVVAVALGLVALVTGVVVQQTPEDRTPVPFRAGVPYTVGDRVPLAGPLVLYGAESDEPAPSTQQLGCRTTDGEGALSTLAARSRGGVVVEGRGLVPLLDWAGGSGHSIVCDGPVAAARAPLYLVPASGDRDLVPVGGFSLAALLLPLGGLGLLSVRAAGR